MCSVGKPPLNDWLDYCSPSMFPPKIEIKWNVCKQQTEGKTDQKIIIFLIIGIVVFVQTQFKPHQSWTLSSCVQWRSNFNNLYRYKLTAKQIKSNDANAFPWKYSTQAELQWGIGSYLFIVYYHFKRSSSVIIISSSIILPQWIWILSNERQLW